MKTAYQQTLQKIADDIYKDMRGINMLSLAAKMAIQAGLYQAATRGSQLHRKRLPAVKINSLGRQK